VNLEIERKFLVLDERWREAAHGSARFRQGYLNDEERCSVRVRISGDAAWLNLKSVTLGAQRHEFEYPIPLADAQQMLDLLSCKPVVEKTRYFVDCGPHTWEIDVFEGDNAGLVVAEIELGSPDEAFEQPPWLGAEVTFDPRYYNTRLAADPYKNWRA
jgi:adenylate cyclase